MEVASTCIPHLAARELFVLRSSSLQTAKQRLSSCPITSLLKIKQKTPRFNTDLQTKLPLLLARDVKRCRIQMRLVKH